MGYIFFEGHSLSQSNQEKRDAIDAQFDKIKARIHGRLKDMDAEASNSKSTDEWLDERIKK